MSISRHPALAAFAELIRRCREEAGYANAGQFYRAHGRELMGCTAKAYQNLERGITVPSPALVERLATALRVGLREDRLGEFAAAYLRVLLGQGRFCDFALSTLSGTRDGARRESVSVQASRRFSAEEARVIHSSKETYWCFVLLSAEAKPQTSADLAEMTGFKQTVIERALAELVDAGVLQKTGAGGFTSASSFLEDETGSRSEEYWNAVAVGDEKGILLEHPLLIRASESDMRQYFSYLMRGLDGVRSLSTRHQGRDTGLFAVDLSLRKLFPF